MQALRHALRDGRNRLRIAVVAFFLALAVPTVILIAQAYSQLKWEGFHQQRSAAEALTRRIDASLGETIAHAEARSFADYSFLILAGEPSANFVQRSPLSAYPVAAGPPGLLGYFQVDAGGVFSTPLLPEPSANPASLGIPDTELAARRTLAGELLAILRDNRLVEPTYHERRAADPPSTHSRSDFRATDSDAPVTVAEKDAPTRAIDSIDSQQAFDDLSKERSMSSTDAPAPAVTVANQASEPQRRLRENSSVADLKLKPVYEKKSARVEEEQASVRNGYDAPQPARTKRREQTAVPQLAASARAGLRELASGPEQDRVTTFESEVDPLEFSLLDGGTLVLFRNVWRDGQRYVQGMLLEQRKFLDEALTRRFRETPLAAASTLTIAYRDSVMLTLNSGTEVDMPDNIGPPTDTLLYRRRLTAPLDGIELIFGVTSVPPGPGATVLRWVTLALGLVFGAGFYGLYRTGVRQIELVGQQQDFVSAVSHELKTPLTSIRMYGEMLREGWAAEEKKQSYYEYIYDESERLTRLISNVLRLANITRNDPSLELQNVAVGDLMNRIEAKTTNQLERAGFELAVHRDAATDAATVRIDEDCFTQVIINLFDNAIKFSSAAEPKRIVLGARRRSDGEPGHTRRPFADNNSGEFGLLFSVRDFGPGIARDQMRRIFEMFYRSENELTRETVGTGIGLAIVHQLMTAMGGKVDVVNMKPGAEFRLFLPATREG